MHSQMSFTSVSSWSYKNTNNSFFISGTYVHLFFGLNRHFFLSWMETHFFGRALSTTLKVFDTFSTTFGCVLEETHGTIFLKDRKEYRYFIIKLTLIELYGI